MSQYDRKDHLYEEAKKQGFRSRAAFKLKELNNRYHFIRSGSTVLDLGAWPGGWMQVAARASTGRGKVVGIDLVEIEGFSEKHVKCITGDVREEEILQQAEDFAGRPFDVILSDMSPKLTGEKDIDRVASVGLAELAFWVCQNHLRPGGSFVVKVFKGNETEEFARSVRPHFAKFLRKELKSTRKTSKEFYLLGMGFKKGEECQQ